MTAESFKKAGVSQSLSWNTTAPVKKRPVMLYLFDSSLPKGRNFEAARNFEVKVFTDSSVVKISEKFICEKICFKNELTKSYRGREVLNAYKRELNKTPLAKRSTQVVFLSANGEVLHVTTKAKSAGKFAQQMKLALNKNAKALETEAKKVAMR